MKVLYIIDDYPKPPITYGITLPYYILKNLSGKIQVHPIFVKERFLKSFLFTFFKSIKDLIKFNPDIIQGSTGNTTGVIAVILGLLFNKKTAVFIRGSDVLVFPNKNFIFELLIKFVLKYSDCIIAVGNKLKDKSIKLGADKEKIHVVYYGTELNKFNIPQTKSYIRKKLNLSSRLKILIYIGNLIKNKRVDDILYALSDIKRKNWCFIIIGKGKEENKLKYLAQKLDINKNVVFYGPRDYKDIPFYLKAADIFISASISEGTPNVMFESLAAGLPIIFTKVGDVPKILNKNNAILVNPGDRSELSKAIEELLNNSSLRKTLGLNNKILAKKYNAKKSVYKVLKIYKNLLNIT